MPQLQADDGCPLHYRLEGDAGCPVVMLSNSLGTTLDMWDLQMPALLERYRVLRYDSRGHGGSGVTPGPYSIERLGRDALALMDGLGLKRVAWCGLSKGGMVGLWLAIHAPERLSRAVFANTAAKLGPRSFWDERISLVMSRGMEAIADIVLTRWFTAGFSAENLDLIAKIRAMLLSTAPEGYAGCCAAIRDMDFLPGLSQIRLPALVIVGEADPATPPQFGQQIANAIPRARLMTLPAAHMSNIESPAAFTAALFDFFSTSEDQFRDRRHAGN